MRLRTVGTTVMAVLVLTTSPATTTTDANGRYELRVPGDALGATATLTATKVGYSGGSQSGSVSKVGSLDGAINKDIELAATDTRTMSTAETSSATTDSTTSEGASRFGAAGLPRACGPTARP